VELRTDITSGKRRNDLQDLPEDPRAEICKVSKPNVQRVTNNDGLDIVERLTPPKWKKKLHIEQEPVM
jgi:hypothetical protein